MPNKQYSSDRDRKKNSKNDEKKFGKYSSKHIRIKENNNENKKDNAKSVLKK